MLILNSREENSEDFCLDFVQEFGLPLILLTDIQAQYKIIMYLPYSYYSMYVILESSETKNKHIKQTNENKTTI